MKGKTLSRDVTEIREQAPSAGEKKVMLHFITFYGCSRFLFLMSSLLFPFHLFFEWSFLITFFSYFFIFTVFSLFSKTFFLVWFTVLFLFIVSFFRKSFIFHIDQCTSHVRLLRNTEFYFGEKQNERENYSSRERNWKLEEKFIKIFDSYHLESSHIREMP